METKKSHLNVKLGIAFNFLSIIGIVLIFEYCQVHGWTTMFKVVEFTLIALLSICFYLSFIKTGLWQFSHKSFIKVDERELLIINRSLRYAYAIFSVIVLCLLLLIALLKFEISIVLAVSMILLAHLIPASIIGCSEKPISYGRE